MKIGRADTVGFTVAGKESVRLGNPFDDRESRLTGRALS